VAFNAKTNPRAALLQFRFLTPESIACMRIIVLRDRRRLNRCVLHETAWNGLFVAVP
jgi:hypothetical protein